MKKILTYVVSLLCLGSVLAWGQSSPGFYYNFTPTAAQWNSYFASKQDVLGYTPLNKGGDTMQGTLVTAPAGVTAGLNIVPGSTPSAPNNGDLWTTTAGLFARINGTTFQVGGGSSVSAGSTLTANQLVIGGGGSTVNPLGSLGTTTTILHGNASGAPAFSAVDLTADVTNSLPTANGGLGANNSASSGVPLFSSGAVTMTATSGSGNIARVNGATHNNIVLTGSVTTPVTGGGVQCLQADNAGALTGVGGACAAGLVPQNYKSGLTLSTAGSSGTFGITAGEAADTTNAHLMIVASAYTKTTGSWAVGTGNGCLDTGTIANNTWYHIYEIERTDLSAVDYLCSTSYPSPTMPANYTFKRRIGSMRTDASATWIFFRQNGNYFYWNTSAIDASSAAPTGSFTAQSFTVPSGVQVRPIFSFFASVSGSDNWSIEPGDYISSATYTPLFPTGIGGNVYIDQLFTNTSGQLKIYGNSGTYSIFTQGWVDDFGRN